MKKRTPSSLLALCLLLTLLPTPAMAREQPPLSLDIPAHTLSLREQSAISSVWQPVEPPSGGVYEAYRAQLDPTAQTMYDKLKAGFATPVSSVDIVVNQSFPNSTGRKNGSNYIDWSPESLDAINGWLDSNLSVAFLALQKDHPEMPWIVGSTFGVGGHSVNLENARSSDGVNYTFTAKIDTVPFVLTGVPAQVNDTAAFTNAVSAAIQALNNDNGSYNIDAPGKTTYEKVKGIHDYVCALLDYESSGGNTLHQTAYSALVAPNLTVCAGYAGSFKLLCDYYSIPCVYVAGHGIVTGKDEPHAWNYVQMDDGNWYAVDCTWDDQGTYGTFYDFFLVGRNTPDTDFGGKAFSASHVENGVWSSDDHIVMPYPTLSNDKYIPAVASVTFGADGIDDPADGQLPDTSATLRYTTEDGQSGNLTLRSVTWYKDGGQTTQPFTGGAYTVSLTLAPPNGYRFATTAGLPEGYTLTVQGDGSALLSKDFAPLVQSGSILLKEGTLHGAVSVSHTAAAPGDTVTITVTPDKGYTLETLVVTDQNGAAVALTNQGDGTHTFVMPSGTVTVQATFMDDNTMLSFFVDVPASAYYYDAVLWAVEKGITTGTSPVSFSPNADCTRAQIVTFLWRAAGSPAPQSTVDPFSDVAAGSYYYDAVLWAVEQGITTGTGDATFSPDATCTRGQTVTFLHRTIGSPDAGTASAFADVSADAYYAAAVNWAVEQGVTQGTGDATFSPDAPCARGQIVTFLYRAYL